MKSIAECYVEIKRREIAELKEALAKNDNYVYFVREKDVIPTGETHANCIADEVWIMVNHNEPEDVRVVEVDNLSGELKIIVRGRYDDADWIVDIDEIAYGHIEFITASILYH